MKIVPVNFKILILVLVFCAGIFFSAGLGVSTLAQTRATITPEDAQFISNAAAGGMAEIELGQLAAQRAKNSEVKAFAERMVRDHTTANVALKQLASQKGVTLPTSISSEQKLNIKNLKKLHGENLDRRYIELMVEDHDKDVAEFEAKASNASDTDVKEFVNKTLPTLKEHQRLAHEIKDKLSPGLNKEY